MFPIDRFFVFLKIYLWETCFLCFQQRKKHLSCFKKINFEKNKKFIYGKPERNTFCVSMAKTLWKSQNVSLNGFFQGKHHPAPAVPQVEANASHNFGPDISVQNLSLTPACKTPSFMLHHPYLVVTMVVPQKSPVRPSLQLALKPGLYHYLVHI